MIERIPTDATNGEAAALADELRLIDAGDAWHGPALAELLEGVSAAAAAARPIAGGHSIWELVGHIAGWNDVWRRRLDGEVVDEPEAGDFPPTPAVTEKAWAAAKDRLREAHAGLVARVAALTAAELDARIPGREFTARFMVEGAIRHVVYHSGQIGLLRKALAGGGA